MKISCQSCQAKYTIADEKVLGKVVKIRCKKCGATIVINGAEAHEQQGASDDGSAGGDMLDYGGGEQWTVNVADGDQRTMSTGEIANEYRNGTVTSETYCWKDGMDGWLPIRDIDQLFAAVSAPSMHPASAGSDFAPVMPPVAAAPLFGGASPNLFGGGGGGGGGGGESVPAARRERSRNAGADLFGGVAQAGGEDDRMVAAPVKDEPKLTGQRNESSVLFSLASLTKEGENGSGNGGGGGGASSANKSTAQGDASGLIDIRALSAGRAERPKSSGVDDIMNLGGGGAFGAALTAPILAPPAMDPGIAAADAAVQSGGGSNKGIIFAIIGGVGFLTVAVVLAIVFTRQTPTTEPLATKGGTGATGSGALAANDPPKDPGTAAATAAPAPTPEATAKEPGGGTVGAAKPTTAGGGTAPKKPETAGGGGTPTPPPPTTAPAATGGKTKSMEQAMCEATGTCAKAGAAAPAAASGAAFDRGAAAASLGGVNVASCKKPDGPTGSGHITVTFAPSGSVSSAVVDGGSFPGTPVGGCIAGKYRGARVPAFGGSPVKVGKSFSL